MGAGEFVSPAGDAFIWKSGHAEVTLSMASDGWVVIYTTAGRLLGPPQVLHQARHREAKHAAWDVMARVQIASRNPDEGLRAGQSAVRWIKSRPQWVDLRSENQDPPDSR